MSCNNGLGPSGRYAIHVGDCLDITASMDAKAIDAVVTDPPYGMKWDPDSRRFSGGTSGKKGRGKKWGKIIGDDQPFDPSPWLRFPKVAMFGCNHFASRLPVGTVLVWIKKNDRAFGSFLSDAEIAWMKGGHGVYCYRHGILSGKHRKHPTQKPVEVMEWVIKKLRLPEGASILDPYCGSGSTGVAAVRNGYKFVGIEMDQNYAAIADQRIQDELARVQQESSPE